MRSCYLLAAVCLGAGALAAPAHAFDVVYNSPGVTRGYVSHGGHYGTAGPVVWRDRRHVQRQHVYNHRQHRRSYRQGAVAGALAGVAAGALVATVASRPRAVEQTYYYGATPHYAPQGGYYTQQVAAGGYHAPAYGYPAAAPVYAQPACVQRSEHLYNAQGAYRGVFPVRICR